VGETLEERESGKLFDVVKAQIEEVVFALTDSEFRKLIVAYEPVWAIGTGKVASAEQAQEMHEFIRKTLAAKFGDLAAKTPILYGGSVKPDNAKEIFGKPDVDGGLIGGASLKAADFLAIGAGF
jgi:triosephosphate isomerase